MLSSCHRLSQQILERRQHLQVDAKAIRVTGSVDRRPGMQLQMTQRPHS